MKKKLLGMLSIMALLLVPSIIVKADDASFIVGPKADESAKGENSQDLVVKTNTTGATYTSYTIVFTPGEAIEDLTCADNGDWKVTQTSADGKISCTYTNANGTTAVGDVVGKITYNNTIETWEEEWLAKQPSDNSDEDNQANLEAYEAENNPCDIATYTSVAEGTSTPVDNPPTGAEMPYVVLIGGVALAGALYFSTNKKSKLHRI